MLRGVDLELRSGAAHVIEGASGGGKTTLLRCLALLHPTTGGQLTLDGRTPTQHGPRTWRYQTMLVPQEPSFSSGSVGEAIERPRRLEIAGGRGQAADLEAIGLGHLTQDDPVDRLSGGERQRLALAIGLARNPRFLLADEPVSALDPPAIAIVERLLRDYVESGGSLLIVSHRPIDLDARVSKMVDGRLEEMP